MSRKKKNDYRSAGQQKNDNDQQKNRGAANKFRRKLPGLLGIPDELLLDLPRVVLIGSRQVYIENHQGIVKYTPQQVVINSGDRLISISGERLLLRNLLPAELLVEGQILTLSFPERN